MSLTCLEIRGIECGFQGKPTVSVVRQKISKGNKHELSGSFSLKIVLKGICSHKLVEYVFISLVGSDTNL